MSNEMEFLGKQSLELSKALATNEESKVGWNAVVTGWLHRWKAREQGTVYASYAHALRQEIDVIDTRRELLLESDANYQEIKNRLATGKIFRDLMNVKEEVEASMWRQARMKNEHDAFADQSNVEAEERRRKALNPNQLLQDDLRILNRQILDLDKDSELDQESRKELLEILLMQKRKLLDSAKGAV